MLSHWPSSPDRTCDAPAGVVERGHAVAIGARRAGDAACAVVECRDAVGVGSGVSGDATGGVVKDAPPSCALAGSAKRVKSTRVLVGFMIVDYPRSGITAGPSRAPISAATCADTRAKASLRPSQAWSLGRPPGDERRCFQRGADVTGDFIADG